MKAEAEVTLEDYGDNNIVKGPLGSRIIDARTLPGESAEEKAKRIAKLVSQAVAEVSDPDAKPPSEAALASIMGIKSEDRLPIESTASGVSFRASSPADIAAYKRHFGYGGN